MDREPNSIRQWAKKLGIYERKANYPEKRKIGSTRFSKGILYVRVSEEFKGRSKDWKPLHRVLWELNNGPVPHKHMVIFKDGMRDDFFADPTVDKLQLVHSRQMVPMIRFTGEKKKEIFAKSVETKKRYRQQLEFAQERDRKQQIRK